MGALRGAGHHQSRIDPIWPIVDNLTGCIIPPGLHLSPFILRGSNNHSAWRNASQFLGTHLVQHESNAPHAEQLALHIACKPDLFSWQAFMRDDPLCMPTIRHHQIPVRPSANQGARRIGFSGPSSRTNNSNVVHFDDLTDSVMVLPLLLRMPMAHY